jgi:hypothetical protein
MGFAHSYKKLIHIYQTILRVLQIDSIRHSSWSRKLKSYIEIIFQNSVRIFQKAFSVLCGVQRINVADYSYSYVKYMNSQVWANCRAAQCYRWQYIQLPLFCKSAYVQKVSEDLPVPWKKGISWISEWSSNSLRRFCFLKSTANSVFYMCNRLQTSYLNLYSLYD